MQSSLNRFFTKNSVLIGSIVCGFILWSANACFNFMAGDWQAFAINVCYITCLNVLGAAVLRDEKNTVQAMIGAIMMTFVWFNVNVFTEMIDESIPSRSRWGLILNIVMGAILFANHFMLTSSRRKKLWRIRLNQGVILFFLVFTIYKIATNVATGQFSLLMIEIIVGISAMFPTLLAIICVEARSGTYSLFQITTFNPIIETSRQSDYLNLFSELGFEKRHVKVSGEDKDVTTVRMKDPFGNYVDITSVKDPGRDTTLIRMNVDNLDRACEFMKSHGFSEVAGTRSLTKSSESVRMISPTGLAIDVIMHIRKRSF